MLILAIETATPWQSVALVDQTSLRGEINLATPSSHSASLMKTIDYLLQSLSLTINNVDLIAVSLGPGSFTGLRIGIATAKSLAYSLSCSLVGVPTLKALAVSARQIARDQDYILPLIDARRNEVYGCLYQLQAENIVQVESEKVAALDEFLAPKEGKVLFCGAGARLYRPRIEEIYRGTCSFTDSLTAFPRAWFVAQLGAEILQAEGSADIISLIPIYIRRPDIRKSGPSQVPQSKDSGPCSR
ncbi:tRNA (adenosine(37)-N6)-threonylcarbamoyltransferase complex dimerization subunit type 1 TsaB [candidate division CSSED10-310 bacterium]|uniref:tRNA (Adenosine(37)-N6)-threonylcarbamoyltransferase complex dimerization subunit type 1 TsaB n=1 Tax=candidate division CSSED10-310 bacterium TaxID=2855610 RepID=A0ABV6YYV8_UNCC1